MPRNDAQLHAWVRLMLGFEMPRHAIVPGHHAPFEYLAHAFFEDRLPRDCLVWANRGGGKTQLGALATLLDLLFKPGIQIRILGGSFEQSSKMYRYLTQLLERSEFADLVAGNITGRAVELVNGSRVEVLSQSHRAVRGQRVHKLRCDEVELFDTDVWEAAQLVTRSGYCGKVHVRGSVEAMSTMHRPFGLMQRLVDESDRANRRLFRWSVLDTLRQCEPQRSCDSCVLYSDCQGRAKTAQGFIDIDDAVDQFNRVGAHTWQAEMLCKQPLRSDSVYREFDQQVHVVEFNSDATGQLTWLGGIDFGYRAPTFIIFAAYDQSTDLLHVVDELSLQEHIVERIIERVKLFPLPELNWIGADPAGHQRSEQTGVSTITCWRRAGFTMRTKPTRLEDSINCVRRRLQRANGSTGLLIDPRCTNLIEAMVKYHYPTDKPESITPVKDGMDHAADALRYLIVNLDRADWSVKVRKY